ncbi:hypothetical protein DIZ48_16140, partial [Legionella pneumophila]|uniref:hypothetical protein n=1 Tax=Legionella pneumophila TaxID=446 RepID=UPI0011376FA2
EQERDEAEAKGHEAFKIGVAHQEARQAAERARDKAQRQLDIVSAQAVQIRDEREFRIRERNRAEARADAAEQEAATLRAQVAAVEALHGKTHWCFGGDLNDLRDDKVYEPGTEHWACPTLAALGDPGPWVD